MKNIQLMTQKAKRIKNQLNYMVAATMALGQSYVFAQSNGTNTTQSFEDVAENAQGAITTATTLAIAFFALVGLIMVANSLINLYKASKDPSHQVKPMAGGVGLIIGGTLLAVGTVVGMSRNTFIGNDNTN